MRPLLLCLVMAITVTACAYNVPGERSSAVGTASVKNQKNKHAKRAMVELDIFSGRENPTWILSRADAESLSSLIEKLPLSEPKPLFEGLGYRGFIVTLPVPRTGVKSVRVYKSIVKLGDTAFRRDAERTVERWLLTKAKSALDQELYELAASEVNIVEGR